MNNFPCVNSILIDRHLAQYDNDDHFNDWLADYEMTQDDFVIVIESLLDKDELLTLSNIVQFILVNNAHEGELTELDALIYLEPSEALHYIAAFVDEMDIDELAAALVKAYERKDTKKNYLLSGLEDAVIHYMDNEPSLYQRYQDEMEARHNDY